jgi:UDP-glucose 4-epimerase
VRVAVTGGNGFIGSRLVDELLRTGQDVVLVDARGESPSEQRRDGARTVCLDVRDTDKLCRAVDGCDAVVHLAASVMIKGGDRHPEEDMENGVRATHSVLEAMRRVGVPHICFASSGSVYGEGHERPIGEDEPLRPISLYGAGKAASEAFLRAYAHLYGISVTILRLAIVLGPGLRRGVVYDLASRARADSTRLELLGDGSQRKSYLAIEDCVSAFCSLGLAAGHGTRVYNIAGDGSLAVTDVARHVLAVLGLSGTPVRAQQQSAGWPGDVPYVELSTRQAKSGGWTARFTSEEAVARGAKQIARERSG